jgi:hypothetical protein
LHGKHAKPRRWPFWRHHLEYMGVYSRQDSNLRPSTYWLCGCSTNWATAYLLLNFLSKFQTLKSISKILSSFLKKIFQNCCFMFNHLKNLFLYIYFSHKLETNHLMTKLSLLSFSSCFWLYLFVVSMRNHRGSRIKWLIDWFFNPLL